MNIALQTLGLGSNPSRDKVDTPNDNDTGFERSYAEYEESRLKEEGSLEDRLDNVVVLPQDLPPADALLDSIPETWEAWAARLDTPEQGDPVQGGTVPNELRQAHIVSETSDVLIPTIGHSVSTPSSEEGVITTSDAKPSTLFKEHVLAPGFAGRYVKLSPISGDKIISNPEQVQLAGTAGVSSTEIPQITASVENKTVPTLAVIMNDIARSNLTSPDTGSTALQTSDVNFEDLFIDTELEKLVSDKDLMNKLDLRTIDKPLIGNLTAVDMPKLNLDTQLLLSTATSVTSDRIMAAAPLNLTSIPPQAHPALHQVAETLVRAHMSQKGVTVRLDPPELGNVSIQFQMDSDRNVTAIVRAELTETSHILRERSELLIQALKENGFENVDLSFEQGSFEFSSGQNFDSQNENQPSGLETDVAIERILQSSPSIIRTAYHGGTSVDLKL